MNKTIAIAGLLAAASGTAHAGAVDRGTQSTAILFEQGNHLELTFGFLQPEVEGKQGLTGTLSGNMYGDYSTGSLAFKMDLGENLAAAFIIDRPYGAKTEYPTGTGYIAQGTTANLSSVSYTGLLKYRFPSNVSLFGGLRYQTLAADADIPFLGNYRVVGERDSAFGYVLGAAWEKPEIAARISLTYNSKIDYELATRETNPLGTVESVTETSTPQSLNLEFQTGVAPNVLVFGGIRWVEWSDFSIDPPVYRAIADQALVFYNDDVITYTLGVGYKFNETWSGAITYMHDDAIGGRSLNLGPVDGYDSIALAATYTMGDVKITGAIRYFALGDTYSEIGPFRNEFEDNDALGLGLRIGYTF